MAYFERPILGDRLVITEVILRLSLFSLLTLPPTSAIWRGKTQCECLAWSAREFPQLITAPPKFQYILHFR